MVATGASQSDAVAAAQHVAPLGGDAADAPRAGAVVQRRAARSPRCRSSGLRRSGAPAPPGRSAPASRCRRTTRAGTSGRADVHQRQVDVAAEAAGVAQLAGHAGDAAGAEVLEADGDALARAPARSAARLATVRMRLRNGSGVCTLPLFSVRGGGVERGRGEGRAAHAAPVGGLADQDQVVRLVAPPASARGCA